MQFTLNLGRDHNGFDTIVVVQPTGEDDAWTVHWNDSPIGEVYAPRTSTFHYLHRESDLFGTALSLADACAELVSIEVNH